MTIAAVAAFCVLLLILAFLVPRLSRRPERGGAKVAGAPTKATSKAPGKRATGSPSRSGRSQKAIHKSGSAGRKRPRQDAAVASGYPGRDSNPHGHKGQWLLRPSCLTNSTTRAWAGCAKSRRRRGGPGARILPRAALVRRVLDLDVPRLLEAAHREHDQQQLDRDQRAR